MKTRKQKSAQKTRDTKEAEQRQVALKWTTNRRYHPTAKHPKVEPTEEVESGEASFKRVCRQFIQKAAPGATKEEVYLAGQAFDRLARDLDEIQPGTAVKTSGKRPTDAKHPKAEKPSSGEIQRNIMTTVDKWLRDQMKSDVRFALFHVGLMELHLASSITRALTGTDLGQNLMTECDRAVDNAAVDETYLKTVDPLQASVTGAIATMLTNSQG